MVFYKFILILPICRIVILGLCKREHVPVLTGIYYMPEYTGIITDASSVL